MKGTPEQQDARRGVHPADGNVRAIRFLCPSALQEGSSR
jgi:hypothetical protein